MAAPQILLSIVSPIYGVSTEFVELADAMPVNFPGVEWIVVHDDDGTENRNGDLAEPSLPAYANLLAGDGEGATAAVNKGIAAAQGRFLLFLMGDDFLVPDGITELLAVLDTDDDTDVFSGYVDFFAGAPGKFRGLEASPPTLSWSRILYGRPCLGSRVFRADLFKKHGPFDTNYLYCSDREFLARIFMSGIVERGVRIPLYRYRVHGGSQTMGGDPGRIARYISQHVRLAEWLQDQSDTERDRMREWQAYETARLIYFLMASGQPIRAICAALHQSVRQPRWLFKLKRARTIARNIAAQDSVLGP
tara:strand:+ start:6867 stop:7784 length:918 start_codon:yes stop_codon:yes gene_type:complete